MKKTKNIVVIIVAFIMMILTYATPVNAESNKNSIKSINPSLQEKFAIKGSMTNEQYQSKYSELNKVQNEEWNKKYNFKPETNVKHVSTWDEYKAAFTDNSVSKIILDADISYTGGATTIDRKESIEIDGQGHLLYMRYSSMRVTTLASIDDFTKNFSDSPVFHMHDLQVRTTAQGQLEGNLANGWAMVNGDDYHGNGISTGRRGIWRYRVGNIITPSDMTASGAKNTIGGRLINGEMAEISMWGWNRISTAAENFYTGGMKYEPYTYHRGEIARYDYSTIWFKNSQIEVPDSSPNKKGLTGNGNFEVGTGSFVYLNNTGNGQTFPAVYEHFKTIDIGEYATFNANVPGSAVAFNEDNQKFLGRKGSKVNLLSRTGSSTIAFYSTYSAMPTPNVGTMKNLSFIMEEDSELYVAGSAANGVIQFNNNISANMELNNVEVFDISNNYRTERQRRFFGSGNSNHKLTITNSDISLWANANQTLDNPSYDFSNIESFSVDGAGNVESSDQELKNTYTASDFRRIAGLNSEPIIEWTPVTDADYSQRVKVLLGNVPIGGSEPYDENGDAKTRPVYANDVRRASVDFKDTLGNTYTGVTSSSEYVTWKKEDHKVAGFQKQGELMNAMPYKIDKKNTRYLDGISRNTQVIDVTPPTPASLVNNNVLTNADRVISGVSAEPGATVYLSLNGKEKTKIADVSETGEWSYRLDNYLTPGDKLTFYMEDKSGKAPESILEGTVTVPLDPKAPATNNTNGNINPDKETSYRDAIFKPALTVTIKDVVPGKPSIEKAVESDTPENVSKDKQLTQVGSTLTYTITAQNSETKGSDKVLLDTVVEDEIPLGLDFDISKVTVTKNGEVQSNDNLTYIAYSDEEMKSKNKQGKLTYGAGDLNPQDSIKIVIQSTVNRTAVGSIINNQANIIGKSPKLEDITNDSSKNIVIDNSANVDNPGGTVFGVLSLISAPEKFDFGKVKLTDFNKVQAVDMKSTENPVIPLVVEDTRGIKSNWRVTATLIEEMNYTKPGESTPSDTLTDSLSFTYKNVNNILRLNVPVTVFDSKDDTVKDEYKISENFWQQNNQDNTKQDGLKMKANKVPTANEYKGKLEWTIEDVKTN